MHHGALPLGWVAVVVGELWPMLLVLISLLLWLFPGGTLPAARWHPAAVVAAAGWWTIDLDTIRSEFAGVVHEAFQPVHVSVWLPGTGSHTAVLASCPGRRRPAGYVKLWQTWLTLE